MNYGKLYICATPIGNLGDITIRVLETLKTVDLIAAEDTRHSLKLLNYFDIKKPMTSYFEHNKTYKGTKIINEIKKGKNVALVSDAGTPIISDPGEQLVKECITEGIEIITMPGACAAISGLTLSGLDCKKFSFEGFLPVKKSEKIKELKKLSNYVNTLIFYEAPHKIIATLEAMLEVFGDRRISISRELTKKYEQTIRLTIKNAIDYFTENDPMGEFVICVEGNNSPLIDNELNLLTVDEHVDIYINEGMTKKDAIKQCAVDRNIPKREIYNLIMKNE